MSLLDRAFRTGTARSASSAWGTWGCRWRWSWRKAGFHVTGFDVDAWKVAELNAGRSYIPGRADGRVWRRS